MDHKDDVELFIKNAIRDEGQSGRPLERAIFLLSELEILCDMEGIDYFIARYSDENIKSISGLLREAGAIELSEALDELQGTLPNPAEALLERTTNW